MRVRQHGVHTSIRTFAVALCLAAAIAPGSAQGPTPAKPARPPAAPPPKAAPAKTSAAFDNLIKAAEAAREQRRLEEAIGLYAKAVAQRPDWVEGHWHLGTSYYALDRYTDARDAFRRVTVREPRHGGAWTFKGLCEYRLKNYDTALEDLLKGRALGVVQPDLVKTARYHMAALLNRIEEYEEARRTLHDFVHEGDDSPAVIELLGISALRLPLLPTELPPGKREQVMMTGRATYFAGARLSTAARAAFDELLRRYPEVSNIRYAYGLYLITENPDEALEKFHAELEVTPRHPMARLQIALEHIKRGEWPQAQKWAEEAVAEGPTIAVARKTLGQVLLETGEIERAISELEAGMKLSPDSPVIRFTLARAYRRAGRTADAERQQAEFTRLSQKLKAEQGPGGAATDLEAEPIDGGVSR